DKVFMRFSSVKLLHNIEFLFSYSFFTIAGEHLANLTNSIRLNSYMFITQRHV
ncbi:hypothetical protein L9F63_022967, partial [Diploptera punctata]